MQNQNAELQKIAALFLVAAGIITTFIQLKDQIQAANRLLEK